MALQSRLLADRRGWPLPPCQCRKLRKQQQHWKAASAAGRYAAAAAASGGRAEGWAAAQAAGAEAPPPHRGDVHVVLVSPQIPQNTGNVARSCAATSVQLHLVRPLGFDLTDAKLKRAGLDYWPSLRALVHESWEDFIRHFQSVPGPRRLVGFSVYGDTYYGGPEFKYSPGDYLVFGAETTGLPLQAHEDIRSTGGRLVKIPIQQTLVRSLNLSVCVGVGLFEALRQLDAGRHEVVPRDDAAVRLPTPMQQQLAARQAAGAGERP